MTTTDKLRLVARAGVMPVIAESLKPWTSQRFGGFALRRSCLVGGGETRPPWFKTRQRRERGVSKRVMARARCYGSAIC